MTIPPAPQGSGPTWADRLPIQWDAVTELPEPQTQAALNEQNENVLRHCLALDDVRGETRDDDESAPEWARVESKLNAVLDMVSQLVAQSAAIPPPAPCIVQAGGLQWISTNHAPRVGDLVELALYLSPRYPRPVRLHAKVLLVQNEPEGQRISAAFEGISEPVRDGLEKLVFRRHRRLVAHARRRG